MKFTNTTSLGNYGEDLACQFLTDKNYTILERNFTNTSGRKIGEIDIIAQKDQQLIFIEVKTRIDTQNNSTNIPPELNITKTKLRALERIAQIYINQHNHWNREIHFDALAITINPASRHAKIRHLKDIFL